MTSLVTLWCRALEAQSEHSRLDDPTAVELVRRLTPAVESSRAPLLARLARGEVHPMLVSYVALRARHFDRCARAFLRSHPDGYVANLGCGFDTRFHRIDDGRFHLYDLDRGEIIRLKRRLVPLAERYHLVEASVLEADWMDALPPREVPAIVLAEGLFMYLPPEDVRALVSRIGARFDGELVAEVFHRRWLGPSLRWIVDRKLRRALGFGPEASFRSGLERSDEMESWSQHLRFLDDWSPFDEPGAGFGPIAALGGADVVRRIQWVVRYRIGRSASQ